MNINTTSMTEEKVSGAELIAQERKRQTEVEGWTPKHDAKHQDGELYEAAICYLRTPFMGYEVGQGKLTPQLWPWDEKYWKPCPNDRVRELVKAGALIAAEIDRLQNS